MFVFLFIVFKNAQTPPYYTIENPHLLNNKWPPWPCSLHVTTFTGAFGERVKLFKSLWAQLRKEGSVTGSTGRGTQSR